MTDTFESLHNGRIDGKIVEIESVFITLGNHQISYNYPLEFLKQFWVYK